MQTTNDPTPAAMEEKPTKDQMPIDIDKLDLGAADEKPVNNQISSSKSATDDPTTTEEPAKDRIPSNKQAADNSKPEAAKEKPTKDQVTPACVVCKKPGSLHCSQCHNVRYCSKNCQQKNWPVHKLICKSFSELPDRPSPEHLRCIYFPEDENRPRFVYATPLDLDSAKDEFFDGAEIRGMNINWDMPSFRALGCHLTIIHKESFVVDGSPPNGVLTSIIDNPRQNKGIWTDWVIGRPRMENIWRGPFLVYGRRDAPRDQKDKSTEGVDLDTVALKAALDYFRMGVRYPDVGRPAGTADVRAHPTGCLCCL